MANTTHESLAAEAAAHLASSAGAVGCFNGIQQKIREQADCLLEWARERGLLLADFFPADLENPVKYQGVTGEHAVYFGAPDNRVIKCTKPGRFGWGHGVNAKHCPATPWFYLQRVELMNLVFATDFRLEGIALGRPDSEDGGALRPYIVTSQSFIERIDEKHEHPSEREIEGFMVELKFRLMEYSCTNWHREFDGITVTDTREVNFIVSHAGIVPVDLVISKNDQEQQSAPP